MGSSPVGLVHGDRQVAGEPTHHVEAGVGPAFLLIPPSAFLVVERYDRVMAGLAGRFRVLAPEQPGTGRSGRLDRAWGFEAYAHWAAAFLDSVGVDRAVVAGHSTGGGIALALASLYPERVERLVLVDTVGDSGGRSPARMLAARMLDGLLEMPLNLRAWPDPIRNVLTHRRCFFDHIAMALTADLSAHAARVQAPTLLAWGERDHLFPPRVAEAWRDRFARASLHVSPTGSHDWLLLEPEAFVAAVLAWTDSSG